MNIVNQPPVNAGQSASSTPVASMGTSLKKYVHNSMLTLLKNSPTMGNSMHGFLNPVRSLQEPMNRIKMVGNPLDRAVFHVCIPATNCCTAVSSVS